MPLINIVIVLLVVGVGLYLINTYVPMAAPIKTILNIAVVVCVLIWVLQCFGVFEQFDSYRIGPRYHR